MRKINSFLFILPYNYLENSFSDGYKKDALNYISYFNSKGYHFEIFYYKNFYFYNKTGNKIFFLKLLYNKYKDFIFLFIPYYSFRFLHLTFIHKTNVVYVADSILKTSIYAFRNNFLLFHRVIISFLFELCIHNDIIIVVSIDEYLWFSSSNYDYNNLFFIPPIPDVNKINIQYQLNINNNKILFLGVSGKGLDLLNNTLKHLDYINFYPKIFILSKQLNDSQLSVYKNLDICLIDYVEDLNSFLCDFPLAIITDIGGSGFSNRALQVRCLGLTLLSTLDGIRGTSLIYDKKVFIYKNESELTNYLSNISLFNNSYSNHSMKNMIDLYNNNIDKMINRLIY
jgi:hypothetical protein